MRHFLAASLISSMGTGMAMLAAKLYVRETTGSNALVGYLGAVGFTAGILAMGGLGTIIDRYDRRRVMVWADSYRMALGAAVPLAILAGFFDYRLLFAVTFLMGVGHTLAYPNLSAMVAEISPPAERAAVNGLNETCLQVGVMAGAAISGFVYKQGGIGLVYVVDMATFLVSGLLFLTMEYAPIDDGQGVPATHPGESDFAAGLRYLRERPLLMLYGLAVTLPWVATMSLNTVLPGLVLVRLHGDALQVGVLDAAYSLGGVAAGLAGGLAFRSFGAPVSMAALLGLSTACIWGLMGAERLGPAVPLMLLFGLGNSGFRVIHRTFIQGHVPIRILGRVLSLISWAGISAAAIGMVITGRAMDQVGESAGLVALLVAEVAGFGLILLLWALGLFQPDSLWRGPPRRPMAEGGRRGPRPVPPTG